MIGSTAVDPSRRGVMDVKIGEKMSPRQYKKLEQEARSYNYGLGEKFAKKAQNDAMGRDQFLELLTTQLSHQDPLSPMDNKDFIAQMAQFSSLEQMLGVNKSLESMKDISLKQSAFSMLNHDVTFVDEAGNALDGNVKSLSHETDGLVKLGVDTKRGRIQVDPSDVISVRTAEQSAEK